MKTIMSLVVLILDDLADDDNDDECDDISSDGCDDDQGDNHDEMMIKVMMMLMVR